MPSLVAICGTPQSLKVAEVGVIVAP